MFLDFLLNFFLTQMKARLNVPWFFIKFFLTQMKARLNVPWFQVHKVRFKSRSTCWFWGAVRFMVFLFIRRNNVVKPKRGKKRNEKTCPLNELSPSNRLAWSEIWKLRATAPQAPSRIQEHSWKLFGGNLQTSRGPSSLLCKGRPPALFQNKKRRKKTHPEGTRRRPSNQGWTASYIVTHSRFSRGLL
jgi:hypothetical protein